MTARSRRVQSPPMEEDGKDGDNGGEPVPRRRGPATLGDHRGLAEFRHQIRKFLSFSERAARAVGMEPQQHQLLLALKGLPAGLRPNIGTVAERLCVEHNTTVALVDHLVAGGYLQRQRSQQDGREVMLVMTEAGETAIAGLSKQHRDHLLAVGPGLVSALGAIISGASPRRSRSRTLPPFGR